MIDSTTPMALHLVVPGPLETVTGGFIYDRQVVLGLRARGHTVTVHVVPLARPGTGDAGTEALAQALARIEDGALTIVDGLAAGDHPRAIEACGRLVLVALVHHPLAFETGIAEDEQVRLRASERRTLAAARAVICTSPHTSTILGEVYGVPPGRTHVVRPGIDARWLDTEERGDPVVGSRFELLCVATLTPRKGHAVLLHALARVHEHPWRLTCIGSEDRSPETAAEIHALCDALGLADRVRFRGEVDVLALVQAMHDADLFVLASHYEGYGMALAEAVAMGRPVITTNAGAIVDTVPSEAAILVPPNDPLALASGLARFFGDAAFRRARIEGARRARGDARTWDHVVVEFEQVLACIALAPEAVMPGSRPEAAGPRP